jgi:hypothetical protein
VLNCHTEILDFGYPQNSEIDTLKMYITTESVKSEMAVVRMLGLIRTLLLNLIRPYVARRIFEDYVASHRERQLASERR